VRVERVRESTERRILAVTTELVFWSPGGLLAATGTRRRIQSLVAIGFPIAALADHMGGPIAMIGVGAVSGRVWRGGQESGTPRPTEE